MYRPHTIATPLTVIRRERMLPGQGEILVRPGERVDPLQVIGRANVSPDFRIVNVARQLRVRASTVSKYLKVEPGERVRRGQVVGAVRGLSARTCRSPIEGIVTESAGGQILIESPPQEVELVASIQGVVDRVIPEWGVVIRTTGLLIQGVWGNSKTGSGILRLIAQERTAPLETESIDPSSRGLILVAGYLADAEVIRQAIELQLRGIVVGSLSAAAMADVEAAPFPVIATEGIGDTPMCSRIHHLLAANDGREATLDSHFRNQWGVIRPEILVPLPAEPEAAESVNVPLEIDDTVRVVLPPYLSVVGVVKELALWTRTATGFRLPAARVAVDDSEEEIVAPLVNLEIMR